ncbi:hypothetical protein ACT6QG_05470 [Xanthobacter sp. TB0136]|uniref:hypothetical protein n=1 Tax=Xanthobacter sp. TB0136 TaxID=3459177 RepID=UPI0040395B77
MRTALATMGHNNPPAPIEIVKPIIASISDWLADNPIFLDQPTASKSAAHLDRIRKHIADLEDERKRLVKPLNDEVKGINAEYKEAISPLEKLSIELKSRATAYARAEEDRRRKEAEAARKAAEEAARIAREAAEREAEAAENAAVGEVVDMGEVMLEAEAAGRAAQLAAREAARAERDAHVRMKAGNARAMSLRTTLVFEVTDPVGALIDLPLTDGIRAEIIKAARAYHKEHGKPPSGVSVREERSV